MKYTILSDEQSRAAWLPLWQKQWREYAITGSGLTSHKADVLAAFPIGAQCYVKWHTRATVIGHTDREIRVQGEDGGELSIPLANIDSLIYWKDAAIRPIRGQDRKDYPQK